MSKLLAFGCSNTYGHGLEDCIMPNMRNPGLIPSKFAWPSVVADQLKITLLNQSQPGASNKEIWNQILTNNFEKNDIVIIMWSAWGRWCILHEDKELTQIGPWIKNKLTRSYYKSLYNDFDNGLDFWLRVNHIYMLLESLGISQYHLTCNDIKRQGPKEPCWNKVKLTPVDFSEIRKKYPKALDGSHANEDAHKDFGMQLADYIQKYKY